MRWSVLLLLTTLTISAVASAQSRFRFESPGAAAAEAIERRALCRSIQRAGGQCPAESVPIQEVQAYYARLVDGMQRLFALSKIG
jgi:hypothetical protein